MTDDEKLQIEKDFSEVASRVWTPKIVKPDDEIPDLFHYTNAAGLLGILKSRSLWATHFRSLNDPREMHYGLDKAHVLIDSLIDDGPDEKREFLRGAAQLLDRVGATPYVVSFSDDGRLPSQWREYGDGGAGFSIALDLRQSSTLFGKHTSVIKITYDLAAQREILSATMVGYWEVLLSWKHRWGERFDLPSAPEANIEFHCQANLVSLLLAECVAFKDRHFENEREWRLARLVQGSSPVQFRAGRVGIIPYIELRAPSGEKLPIKKVILGPTADRSSAEHSIQMLLEDCKYDDVEIEVSTTPPR